MTQLDEFQLASRQVALAHAVLRGSQGPYKTADEVVKEAETFRKFLDGESNGN